MQSSSHWYTGGCPEEWVPTLRELLTYDMLCPTCVPLTPHQGGVRGLEYQPSPLHWSRQYEWPWAIHSTLLSESTNCLDVGSGWSVLKYALANRVCSVFCVDNDLPSVDKACKTTELMGRWEVSHYLGDARQLPEAVGEDFDRVFCISVLEHIPDGGHRKAMEEIVRVLKPGGIAVITMDVAFKGDAGQGNNFYITEAEANRFLFHWGIPAPTNGPPALSLMQKEGVEIGVLCFHYVKPDPFPNKRVEW